MTKHPPRTFYLTEREISSAHMFTLQEKVTLLAGKPVRCGQMEFRWRERTPRAAPQDTDERER